MNTPQTWRDPIVEEIHAIRECLAKQYDNDLAAYSQAADTHCRALGGGLYLDKPVQEYPRETAQQAMAS